MTEAEYETIHMWYMGHRIDSDDGKMYHLWLAPDGNERSYDKVKAQVVGGLYECKQRVGTTSVLTSVTFLADRHDQARGWIVESRAADTVKRARALEKKAMADRTPVGELTIADAAVWINKTFGEHRRARIAVILDALGVG